MNPSGALAGVNEGDVLAGKYRVDRVLGVGGMGVVVAAHHLQLDDRVAIKFLLPETLGNKEAVQRFAREARAAVKIKSEHVGRVTDVGTLENGAPYMVMEYLEGGDLAAWLAERGPVPLEQAVDFVLQACEAIAEAHTLGIVHRDLKPANLFVAKLPGGVRSVKVLDFGISKVTLMSGSAGQSSAATKTSSLMGSPLYMSPEQMQSPKDVDSRSDIWAIGVILYEITTGASPFIADTMPELVLKIMSSAPRPPRELVSDFPERFESVILRCLEKDRGKRFQTVGELAVALLPFGPRQSRASVDRISQVMQAAGMSASAPPLASDRPPPSLSVPAQTGTVANFGRTATGLGRRPATILGLIAGAVAITGVALFAMRGGSANGATPATPSISVPASEPAALRSVAPPDTQKTVEPLAPPEPRPAEAEIAPVAAPSASSTAVLGSPPRLSARPAAIPRPVKPPSAASASPRPPKPVQTSCDPNYYFDAQGEKHFKPECFH
jgi:serine/threonine protein kinase